MKFSDLAEVNYRINQCPYQADPPDFDDWRPGPDGAPRDCDSYAVGKLRALVARGWPVSVLLLAVCFVKGKGHCVLIVRTDSGDWMLSNGYDAPMPVGDIEKLGWVPDRIQKEGGTWEWVKWIGVEAI